MDTPTTIIGWSLATCFVAGAILVCVKVWRYLVDGDPFFD